MVLRLEEVTSDDEDHEIITARMKQLGIEASLFRDLVRRRAWVVVPTKRTEKAWVRAVFHELSHAAAGDPIPAERVVREGAVDGWVLQDGLWIPGPEERLAVSDPPADKELRELAADRRAHFLSKASVMGRKMYARDSHFMLLDT